MRPVHNISKVLFILSLVDKCAISQKKAQNPLSSEWAIGSSATLYSKAL